MTYTNPLLQDDIADPTIWQYEKDYYLTSTGIFDRTLYHSIDLIHWEHTDIRPFNEETLSQLNDLAIKYDSTPVIYAPTVFKNYDKWLMYISISWKCACVLQSDSPIGPFKFIGCPYVLIDNDITKLDITNEDTFVARDLDNKLYIIWGSHGHIMRTQLTDDGLHLIKNFKVDRAAGLPCIPRRVYEGAYAYYRNGYWYLFAAKGNYTSATDPYEVIVGRSKKLNGTFRNKWGLPLKWGCYTKILTPNDCSKYLGGAHTGEIFTDKDGRTFIFYARQKAEVMHYRLLCLQEIFWDKKGWPYFKDSKTQLEGECPNL